mgnify:FL=1
MKSNLLFIVACFMLCFNLAYAQQSNGIIKVLPYQQNPAPDGITIMWQTNVPCYSWVEYGTDSINTKVANTLVDGLITSNNFENKIRIKDLKPGTKYYYRVCSREIKLYQPYKKEFGETEKTQFHSFKTLSNEPSDFTCLIFNDVHNKLDLFDALYNQVKDVDYDFVFFNGDCFTDLKSDEDALNILAHYNKVINAANKPAYYLRGNH